MQPSQREAEARTFSRFGRAIGITLVLILVGAPVACTSTSTDDARQRPPAQPAGYANTLHVSPRGDDAAPGTAQRPLRTLSVALTRLRPGETLSVHGGTYREQVRIDATSGRRDAPIRVSASPGERPLLVGLLWIREPSYWTIEGLRVTWDDRNSPDDAMVRLYGGTGWVLRDSELWNARSIAALLVDDGPDHDLGSFEISGNCIHDTRPANAENQDHNVYLDDFGSSRAPSGIVERNIIYGAPNGNNIKLGGGNGGGPRNVQVRYNTLYDANRNVSFSIDASDNQVYRNILGKAREANVFSFELDGRSNRAVDNIMFGAPVPEGHSDGFRAVASSGNMHSEVHFANRACDGFMPDAESVPYGRYAP